MPYNSLMIYLLPDYGFCAGVKNAISVMARAAELPGTLYLTHPLLHNKKENQALLEAYHARLCAPDEEIHSGNVVFSAHGHDVRDERRFSGARLFDATCPLISRRYRELEGGRKRPILFLGKDGHPETIGFLSRFPTMVLLDARKNLSEQLSRIVLPKEVVLVCQTTIAESTRIEALRLLKGRTEVVQEFPLCPLYRKRVEEAFSFLQGKEPKDFFFAVAGDPLSSNANEILRSVLEGFPGLEGSICPSSASLPSDVLGRKDVLLGSSTSISGEEVERMYRELVLREKALELS